MKSLEKKRVAIFIDGGNFYRKIRHDNFIPKGIQFDYVKFAEFLAQSRQIVSKTYYIGVVRNHDGSAKSQTMVESQQKMLIGLEKDGYNIRRGRVVYDNKIREKGVDVQLAIDLVIGAVEDTYDIAIVVSSDTDLIPAVRYIRSKGKIVEYVGFSNAPSLGMIKETDVRILLLKEQVEAFRKVLFRGVIIEESLKDKTILKNIKIISTEIEKVTEEHKTPWVSQWTLHTVEIPDVEAMAVADKLCHGLDDEHNWYADYKTEHYHYIIFRNKVFFIDRTSKEQYDEAKRYGISLGIPEYQVDFHPEVKEWER